MVVIFVAVLWRSLLVELNHMAIVLQPWKTFHFHHQHVYLNQQLSIDNLEMQANNNLRLFIFSFCSVFSLEQKKIPEMILENDYLLFVRFICFHLYAWLYRMYLFIFIFGETSDYTKYHKSISQQSIRWNSETRSNYYAA